LKTEDVVNAVGIFRRSAILSDEEIFHALVERGTDSLSAARLVEFLPMVYCRLIFRNSGAQFSDIFRRISAGGDWREKPLSREPVWTVAMNFGLAEIKRGVSGQDLLLVAARSAEFQAANRLLNEGSKLEALVFGSPVLNWPEDGPS
jgi:hypothetical protein